VLEHFAITMGNGEVAIMNVFPGMPKPLLSNLQTIYATSDKVSAHSNQGAPVITGDHAEVPFSVQFQYNRRGSPLPEQANLKYTATLTRNGTRWELSGLAQRQ
jgi:hypothetical protein